MVMNKMNNKHEHENVGDRILLIFLETKEFELGTAGLVWFLTQQLTLAKSVSPTVV